MLDTESLYIMISKDVKRLHRKAISAKVIPVLTITNRVTYVDVNFLM